MKIEKRTLFLILGSLLLVALTVGAFLVRLSEPTPSEKAFSINVSSREECESLSPMGSNVEEKISVQERTSESSLPATLDRFRREEGIHPPGTEEYQERVDQLVLLLHERPEVWDCLPSFLEGHEGSFLKWSVIEALAVQTDSTRSHRILLDCLESSRVSSRLKPTIVSLLSHAEAIPAETVALLKNLSEKKGPLQTLSMEVLARCVGKSSPADQEIVSFLGRSLRMNLAQGDSFAVAGALHAMGITGSDSDVGLVSHLSGHDCPRIRGAALGSLARIDRKGNYTRLRQALRHDRDPSVRMGVLNSFQRSPFSGVEEEFLPDLLWVAQHDAAESVRLEALRFFHRSYRSLPSPVRQKLSRVAETDPSANVRSRAEWYLSCGFEL